MKYLLITLLLSLVAGASSAQAEDKPFANNFAVVWSFTTADRDLINENMAKQAQETLALWKAGTIENIYMNTKAEFSDQEKTANVMFFIKADTRMEASKILNEMTFVKKGISQYQLFPVGLLWLKTNEEK